MSALISKNSDILGASSSALCILHCLISPLIFVLAPIVDSGHSNHLHISGGGFWGFLDLIFLILGLIAVQFTSVRNTIIKKILWGAWLILALGLGMDKMGEVLGHFLMYTGSAGLVVTHIINYFLKK
ncbi:MerC domain-containing protein [Membranihabitans maritimus]|uniref:MerC domain-containing protein n=1 Tax=Membranihabitans maritimus TaxID=2904244 RepID=UPI001F1C55BE|nr:MerC domain-containing protein [Membranihabitans maritimus]